MNVARFAILERADEADEEYPPGCLWPAITSREVMPAFRWEKSLPEPLYICGTYPSHFSCGALMMNTSKLAILVTEDRSDRDFFLRKFHSGGRSRLRVARQVACEMLPNRGEWWRPMCEMILKLTVPLPPPLHPTFDPTYLLVPCFVVSVVLGTVLLIRWTWRSIFCRRDTEEVAKANDMNELIRLVSGNNAVILSLLQDSGNEFVKYIPEGGADPGLVARINHLVETRILRPRRGILYDFSDSLGLASEIASAGMSAAAGVLAYPFRKLKARLYEVDFSQYPVEPEGPLNAKKVLPYQVTTAKELTSTRLVSMLSSCKLLEQATAKLDKDKRAYSDAKGAQNDLEYAERLYALDQEMDALYLGNEINFFQGLIDVFAASVEEVKEIAETNPENAKHIPNYLGRRTIQVLRLEKTVAGLCKNMEASAQHWDDQQRKTEAQLTHMEEAAKIRQFNLDERERKRIEHAALEEEAKRSSEARKVEKEERAIEQKKLEEKAAEMKRLVKAATQVQMAEAQAAASAARLEKKISNQRKVMDSEREALELSKHRKLVNVLMAKARQARDYELCEEDDGLHLYIGMTKLIPPRGADVKDPEFQRWLDIQFSDREAEMMRSFDNYPKLNGALLDPQAFQLEAAVLQERRMIKMEAEAAFSRIWNVFKLKAANIKADFVEEMHAGDPKFNGMPAPEMAATATFLEQQKFYIESAIAIEVDENARAVVPPAVVPFTRDESEWGFLPDFSAGPVSVPIMLLAHEVVPEGPNRSHKVGNFSRRKRDAIRTALSKATSARERSDTYAGLIGDTADAGFLAEIIDLIREQEEEERNEDSDEMKRVIYVEGEDDDEVGLLNAMDPRTTSSTRGLLVGNAHIRPEGPSDSSPPLPPSPPVSLSSSPLYEKFRDGLIMTSQVQGLRYIKVLGKTVNVGDPASIRSAFEYLVSSVKASKKAKEKQVPLRIVRVRKPVVNDVVAFGVGEEIVVRSLAGSAAKVIPRDEVCTTRLPNDVSPINIGAQTAVPEGPSGVSLPESRDVSMTTLVRETFDTKSQKKWRPKESTMVPGTVERSIQTDPGGAPVVPEGPGNSKLACTAAPCVLKFTQKGEDGKCWNAPLVAIRVLTPTVVLTFALPSSYHNVEVAYPGMDGPVNIEVTLPNRRAYYGKVYLSKGTGIHKSFVIADVVVSGTDGMEAHPPSEFSSFVIPNTRCVPAVGDPVLVRVTDKKNADELTGMGKVVFVSKDELRHDGGVSWLDGTSNGVCGSLVYVNVKVPSGRQMRLYGVHTAAVVGGGLNVAIPLPTSPPPLNKALK